MIVRFTVRRSAAGRPYFCASGRSVGFVDEARGATLAEWLSQARGMVERVRRAT